MQDNMMVVPPWEQLSHWNYKKLILFVELPALIEALKNLHLLNYNSSNLLEDVQSEQFCYSDKKHSALKTNT